MARPLSDKAIQQLVKKITKQVEQKPQNKERPSYDNAIVRSEEAENQDELDAQFKYMGRREF
jgi:hypothetical protein